MNILCNANDKKVIIEKVGFGIFKRNYFYKIF